MSHWRDFLDLQAQGGRYLAWKEVARTTGLSRTTAWRLQKRDDFPAPYAISPGRVGYREHEVEAWRISRDHSRARGGPPAGSPHVRQSAQAPAPPPTEAALNAPVSSPRGTQAAEPGQLAGSPAGQRAPYPSAKRSRSPRRRSEHAKAIAQQMLFDF